MRPVISHLYEAPETHRWIIQTNEEHSHGVALLASQFAGAFGMSEWGKVLGLLHDKGKETNAFQQHIRKESGLNPDMKVESDYHHAYIGGILARRCYGKSFDSFFANPIVSHHTGLHDSDELPHILQKPIPSEVDVSVKKENLNKPPFQVQAPDLHHLSRMLFSCLVDADYLDTEAFMDKESATLRQGKATLNDLLPRLDRYLSNLKAQASDTPVNHIRNQVQQQCLSMANSPCGFYSLTVPTGGGKTLSSLLWAMRHAISQGQGRIIIAIPYTSIIVQTAAILRAIFGDANVLEHHSNVDP